MRAKRLRARKDFSSRTRPWRWSYLDQPNPELERHVHLQLEVLCDPLVLLLPLEGGQVPAGRRLRARLRGLRVAEREAGLEEVLPGPEGQPAVRGEGEVLSEGERLDLDVEANSLQFNQKIGRTSLLLGGKIACPDSSDPIVYYKVLI